MHGLFRAGFLLCHAAALAGMPQPETGITVTVYDTDNRPVAGARVHVRAAGVLVSSAETDLDGRAAFTALKPARYEVAAEKDGFETARQGAVEFSGAAPLSVRLTLVPAAHKESVEVRDTATPVEAVSVPKSLPAQEVKQLPSRPATVADALPMLPGVVREQNGALQISGAPEHRSALIVNSADVTDPATGQFGLTVPIDSVETLNVYQTPFLAEYGRFTAGLVSVETRRGGEKWKWELNDPLPEFRIRSWRLRGLKDATPRLNFEGPLLPRKLYISEGLEYEVRKTEVYTLPFPRNQKLQHGVNSFAQLDWVVSGRHLVTGTVHAAPQRLGYVNMDFFNPEPTVPDASTHNYTGTLADRLTLKGGLLESTFSVTHFGARVWAQGTADLILTPEGNRGNYFAAQNRDASRVSGRETYSFAPLNRAGSHTFKIGSYLAGSEDDGQVFKHPVEILDSAGRLLERIAFTHGQPFDMSDFEYVAFVQDHWMPTPNLALDLGLRAGSQEVSETSRLAPRAGVAWSPFPRAGTIFHAGYGWFYDRVPLNIYSFDHYPYEIVTMYGADGGISAGPVLYKNTLGQVYRHNRLIFQGPVPGNFSPQSATWRIQVEQPVKQFLKLRAGYMQNDANGVVVLNPEGPDAETRTGGYLLTGNGHSRYRQLEVTARVRLHGQARELFFSYVRSRARGDLNDFNSFLGSFPVPVIRPNQAGSLPADLPNRFLGWGVVQLPWKFAIAPVFEYRNGFPYSVTDASQQYVGIPNTNLFPNFLSLDSRISKDLKVNPKYSVRLSVSGFNLTNHFNPEAVHANAADPAYGFFFGHRGRFFTADFDVLF